MTLIKLGEATIITPENIQDTDTIISDADLQVNERMKKFAQELKTIAPHASDFLYFTAVMMHAAEAALLDDNGNLKKNADGTDVSAKWEPVGNDSVKWVCSDPSIKPYKNSNNDLFPESELKKAYKKWIGRPLCLDHKSSSVEFVRGVIVDTYWDEPRKRIIALCALDKKNYPDLARKVSTGYATNVSMGVGVGRAVCTEEGCHRVARVESDFCEHMKRRSCYGEVNLDLSPIELSLVVTGADPKAKVKHVIAKDLNEAQKAASALQDYLDGKISLASVDDEEVKSIKEELEKLNERVNKLSASLEEANGGESDDNMAYPVSNSRKEPEPMKVEENQAYSAPEPWPTYASSLQKMVLDTRQKLASIDNNLNKLSNYNDNKLHNSEGSTMTTKEAYWQGTEEPTPGKPQYEKDPGESARMQDKHMVGQKPFPEVGPVDGMHPGVESHEGTEEERKKRLQRMAEAEKRAQIRKAALESAKKELESRGYFQGTEEPAGAGKQQYTPDPLQEKARSQDKHMVGQSPFPGVGDVDGLHPSPDSADEKDELKRKQMLSRANLKATFKKVADDNGGIDKAKSHWDVYAGDHLILSASVDEITRGNSDTVYDAVATKDFGRTMIKKIVADGFESARSRFKGAQTAPPAPAGGGAPAGTPMNEGEPVADLPESVEAPEEAAPEEKSLREKIDEAMQILSDVQENLEEGKEAVDMDTDTLEPVSAAPKDEEGFAKSSVPSMRRTVNAMLVEGFDEVLSALAAHKTELGTAKKVLNEKFSSLKPQQKVYFGELVEQASDAVKKTVADSNELMTAFVRYAQGTDAMLKKEAQNFETSPGEVKFDEAVITPKEDNTPEEVKPVVEELPREKQIVTPEDVEGTMMADDKKDDKKDKDESKKDDEKDSDKDDKKEKDDKDNKDNKDDKDEKKDDNDAADIKVSPEDVDKLPDGVSVSVEASEKPDLTTKEGRAMYRAKLAQQGLQFSDMLGKAHPKGGHTVEGIDAPSDDLAKVERIDEVSKSMNDLANMPPKVRKQAQEIANLVQSGKLAEEDVDGLAAYAVDPEAIKYYKQYWAEAKDSESSEFAKRLTEEKEKAAKASELEKETVRIKRAHDLAYEMRDKGMIETSQIPQQVEEILSWNDEGFNSVKNIVAKQESMEKTASVPQVGLLHSDELYVPANSAPEGSRANELKAVLEARFAGKLF